MAILRPSEIRKMKPEELKQKLSELRLELSKLRAQVHAGGSVKNPGRIREIRRTIARILTIMRERKETQ